MKTRIIKNIYYFNIVGFFLLPLYLISGAMIGLYNGLILWCYNMVNRNGFTGEWTMNLNDVNKKK